MNVVESDSPSIIDLVDFFYILDCTSAFLMAFIPGIFDIARAVKKYYKKRNSQKSSETSSLKKMNKSERCTKLIMTICSEAIQIVVLMLTFFIFMLSLIVSSCIPADNYIDAR